MGKIVQGKLKIKKLSLLRGWSNTRTSFLKRGLMLQTCQCLKDIRTMHLVTRSKLSPLEWSGSCTMWLLYVLSNWTVLFCSIPFYLYFSLRPTITKQQVPLIEPTNEQVEMLACADISILGLIWQRIWVVWRWCATARAGQIARPVLPLDTTRQQLRYCQKQTCGNTDLSGG